MEVILLEDVKSLGKKGQIVKINDGYARNYVLPKKLGLEATAKNLNDLKLEKARQAKQEAEELAAAKGYQLEPGVTYYGFTDHYIAERKVTDRERGEGPESQ